MHRFFFAGIAITVVGMALSACQTISPQEQRARDERQCLSYGFRRGSEGFAACLQRIDLDRRADQRAFHLEAEENFNDFMSGPVYYPRYHHHYRR